MVEIQYTQHIQDKQNQTDNKTRIKTANRCQN